MRMKPNKAMNVRALRALDLATLGTLWQRYVEGRLGANNIS